MNHIETQRLILRHFTEEDINALFSILSDKDVNTFLPMFPLKDAVVAGLLNAENSFTISRKELGKTLINAASSITEAEAESYFDNTIEAKYTAEPLKTTMIQKYFALWGASGEATESYNDVRRMKGLGENFIELKNPNSFPLRCPYGNSDTTTNAEVKAAYGNGQYVYSENVWWAGGSR